MNTTLMFVTTLAIGMLLGAFFASMLAMEANLHDEPDLRRHHTAMLLMQRQAARLAKYKRCLAMMIVLTGCAVGFELWRAWQWL